MAPECSEKKKKKTEGTTTHRLPWSLFTPERLAILAKRGLIPSPSSRQGKW